MHVRHYFTVAALVALGAQALPAQQQTRRVAPVLGVMVGSMSIEPASATHSQVGARSYGLQLDVGMLVRRHLYFGVDLGGQLLRDRARFTQNTTAGEMSSAAEMTYMSAMTGVRTGVLPAVPLALAVNVGASTTMSRRSIDNCVGCDVDELDIPGGAFVEPSLRLGRRNVRLRVTDRVYLTGKGMRSVISVGADFQPRKR